MIGKKKSELTEEQKEKIIKVQNDYNSKILSEQKEIDKLDEEMESIKEKKKVFSKKIKELKVNKGRDVLAIKDSERLKKYKKIDVKKGDIFVVDTGKTLITMGNYSFYSSESLDGIIRFDIIVEGETPTQYRLKLLFDDDVDIENPNRYSFSYGYRNNYKHSEVSMNLKKLNLKDFLSEYSTGFKREMHISNLID